VLFNISLLVSEFTISIVKGIVALCSEIRQCVFGGINIFESKTKTAEDWSIRCVASLDLRIIDFDLVAVGR